MLDHKRNLQTDTTPASSVDYVNLDRRYEKIKLSRKRIYASDTVSGQSFPSPFPLELSLLLLAHNSTPVQDLHHLLLLLLTSCLLLHETHLKFSRGFSSQALLLLSYDVVFGACKLACFFRCSCCDITASADMAAPAPHPPSLVPGSLAHTLSHPQEKIVSHPRHQDIDPHSSPSLLELPCSLR